MSQHRIINGDKFAMVGYDRPLSGYFLIIEDISDEENPKEIFNNLSIKGETHPPTPDIFYEELKKAGFIVTQELKDLLSMDGAFGSMNNIVFWEQRDNTLIQEKYINQ